MTPPRFLALAACAGWLSVVSGCSPAADDPGSAEALPAGEDALDAPVEEAPPQPLLAPGEIRVTVIVLPGDAEVEVDGLAARRRDGVIEIVGKPQGRSRVRVFKGTRSISEDVVLDPDRPAPLTLDLDAPPPSATGRPGPASTGKRPAPAVPADLLMPTEFQ